MLQLNDPKRHRINLELIIEAYIEQRPRATAMKLVKVGWFGKVEEQPIDYIMLYYIQLNMGKYGISEITYTDAEVRDSDYEKLFV